MSSSEIIGLVDAHCFYVSAHCVFEPSLIGRPVVVASNGDAAVVSRSDQAKRLGIKMSQPIHELRDLVAREGLIIRSSNYALYHDMSRRLMQAIADEVDGVDINSVDEAFISLTGVRGSIEDTARRIQSSVLKKVGIPTGVGVSVNKTTAKLCNWASKQWKARTGSVVVLREPERLRKLMEYADVGEVWGIGPRLKEHLNSMGIMSAWQLAKADPATIRRHFGVTVERTVRELNGQLCLGFGEVAGPRKMLTMSRSFGDVLRDLSMLETAIATFTARLAIKLRRENAAARDLRVFIQTRRSATMALWHRASDSIIFDRPTSDTRELTAASLAILRKIYRPDSTYVKAGLIIGEVVSEVGLTPDLFATPPRPKSREVMAAVDRINQVMGENTLRFGRQAGDPYWGLRAGYRSSRATTSWHELVRAR